MGELKDFSRFHKGMIEQSVSMWGIPSLLWSNVDQEMNSVQPVAGFCMLLKLLWKFMLILTERCQDTQ